MSVEILTFGCRLNAFESEVIALKAESAGLRDTVVINSCAVTKEAVAQARQAIRRLKRERPERRVVVTGCAAQIESATFADMAEVDRIIGNDDKLRAEAWRATSAALNAGRGIAASAKIAVGDIMAVRALSPQLLPGFQNGLPRAFVQVQNGCDHRCTFCVFPFGRGPSRSLPMASVVDQVRALVGHGHAEIVLTGVDLTSYGGDLPNAPKLGLLAKEILRQVPELRRLRISSVDSIEVDRDLLDVIADDARLMPHLHLSLQSGCDLILKRMKRRHSRQQAIDFCTHLQQLRPDIALGADLIAGFPTESEEMFMRSEQLVEECGLTLLHVFPYSPRPGTPAARMPQLNGDVIRERARRLRAAGEVALRRRLDREIGRTRDILIESKSQGRTEHFLPVAIDGARPGAVQRLRIGGHRAGRLTV